MRTVLMRTVLMRTVLMRIAIRVKLGQIRVLGSQQSGSKNGDREKVFRILFCDCLNCCYKN